MEHPFPASNFPPSPGTIWEMKEGKFPGFPALRLQRDEYPTTAKSGNQVPTLLPVGVSGPGLLMVTAEEPARPWDILSWLPPLNPFPGSGGHRFFPVEQALTELMCSTA